MESVNTPWKKEKWFTSPWNFEPNVIKDFKFTKSIDIHDITLRDGEQQAGIAFNRKDKLKIAEKLIDLGIHRIEAGMPVVSKHDEQAIKDIVNMAKGTNTKVFSFARCMKDDVDRSLQTGVDGVVVEIPSSEHIIKYAYKWPYQKAIDLSIEATLFAKENNLYTVFFPIDATRANIDQFLELIVKISSEGHMDALAIVDTFGGLSPNTIRYLVQKIKSKINKPLEAHFHDDFGLAAANTLIALSEGVEVAHTTVTGIGERAGNAAYEDVVLALLTMYNVEVNIKTEKMYETSKIVQELSGIKVPTNRAIVGENIYDVESGIITSWLVNAGEENILELCPFRNDLVGQKKFQAVLGKNSGKDNIKVWLKEINVDLPDDKIDDLLLKVKEKALSTKKLLSKEDFIELIKEDNTNI